MGWSYVEHRLFLWFWQLSGMSEKAARAVFFSAKAFRSRSEMLQALVRSGSFPRKITKLITYEASILYLKDALAKADTYSQFRNLLAHGLGISDFTEDDVAVSIIQGGITFTEAIKTATNLDKLSVASANFEKLSQLIGRGKRCGLSLNGSLGLLLELHEQLLQLPNQPDCEKPSQNQLGRLHQRKLAGWKASKISLS